MDKQKLYRWKYLQKNCSIEPITAVHPINPNGQVVPRFAPSLGKLMTSAIAVINFRI